MKLNTYSLNIAPSESQHPPIPVLVEIWKNGSAPQHFAGWRAAGHSWKRTSFFHAAGIFWAKRAQMLTVVWEHGKGSEESNQITWLLWYYIYVLIVLSMVWKSLLQYLMNFSFLKFNTQNSRFPTVFNREDTVLWQISKSIFSFVPVNCQRQ